MITDRLKQLRSKNNLSQPEMASILGIPLATYRSYEQGKREPNHEILIKISDILNTSTDYLLGKETVMANLTEESCPKYNDLTPNEKLFFENYMKLSSEERVTLIETLKKMTNK